MRNIKQTLALLSTLFMLTTATAQNNEYHFFKHYDLGAEERGYWVEQTNDGNFVLYGSTGSSFNNQDLFLMKVDTIGNVLWSKSYGGSSDDNQDAVSGQPNFVKCFDGGFAMVNTTLSYGAGEHDIYLIKTNETGDIEWSKTIGDTARDFGDWLLQTADSGFVIIGHSYSYNAAPNYELLCTKLNKDGLVQWTKTYDYPNKILDATKATINNTGYLICARQEKSNDHLVLIQLDFSGNLIWSREYYSNSPETPTDLIMCNDGGILVSMIASLESSTIILKTDSIGNILWQKKYSLSDAYSIFSIREIDTGRYILLGQVENSFEPYVEGAISEIDNNGNVLWSKSYHDPNYNRLLLRGLNISSDSSIIAIGFGSEFFVTDEDVYFIKTGLQGELSCNSNDVTVLDSILNITDSSITLTVNTVSPIEGSGGIQNTITVTDSTLCTDTIIDAINSKMGNIGNIKIYPNPSDKQLSVELHLPNQKDVQFLLYDVNGDLVLSQEVKGIQNAIKENIDLSKVKPGTYVLKVKSGQQMFHQQVVVQ